MQLQRHAGWAGLPRLTLSGSNYVQEKAFYLTRASGYSLWERAPDTTPPVITLNGSANIIVGTNTIYIDAGATATDNMDGTLTSAIITINPVNTTIPGTYLVTYNVTDSSGNRATQVTRTVNVIKTVNPKICRINPFSTRPTGC